MWVYLNFAYVYIHSIEHYKVLEKGPLWAHSAQEASQPGEPGCPSDSLRRKMHHVRPDR
jgi:hypothetical protein